MKFVTINDNNIEIAAGIFKRSFNAEPWCEKWDDVTAKKRISQIMRSEGAVGLITYVDDIPTAIIVGHEEDYYDGTRFLIKEFCVDNISKGNGVGTKTLEYYMNILKKRNIVQVSLYTLREKRVLNFYEKSGFKEIENLVMMELFN
ncbi:MAG: GNAT family N-acetyltransferase [Sarcina sp.]